MGLLLRAALVFAFGVVIGVAQGAPRKASKAKPEVYASTEGEIEGPMIAPAPTDISPKPAAPRAVKAPVYEFVPADQVDGVARRLQVVGEIILRHRRAYDYRTHTVKQLQAILAQLDSQASEAN